MLGATSIVFGILWDISWHRTIGRDTFWTPAHLAIQLGGLLGGFISGWLVLNTTFRGTAEAFATDHIALGIARHAVELGLDAGLTKDQRLFLFLPFEHSENLDDQRESVRLISGLGDQRLLQFALDHQDMIERFGRFPHRNTALGRADRKGEAEAVADGHNW